MLILTGANCSPDKQIALLVALRHKFTEAEIWRMFTKIGFDGDFSRDLNLSRNEIRLSYLSDAVIKYRPQEYNPSTGTSDVRELMPSRGRRELPPGDRE